jgi:ABC-type uncharacterized transport system ATPase subunit
MTTSERPGSNGKPLLVASDIVVELHGTKILRGASLAVREGEIHVLIGPNGAGKTTLANVMTGHVRPVSGTVELRGQVLSGPPWRRTQLGVGRKFQVPRVFPRLTVAQNLLVAGADRAAADSGVDTARLDSVRTVKGESLSHGWRQWLETEMVLSRDPSIVVLDEPTAGMPKSERTELAQMIKDKPSEITYLIVEHDMDFVAAAADHVSFMHDGQVLASGTFAEISAHPVVREVYLGISIEQATEPVGAQAS